MLMGRQAAIHAELDRKLAKARQPRQLRRSQADADGLNHLGSCKEFSKRCRVSYGIFANQYLVGLREERGVWITTPGELNG